MSASCPSWASPLPTSSEYRLDCAGQSLHNAARIKGCGGNVLSVPCPSLASPSPGLSDYWVDCAGQPLHNAVWVKGEGTVSFLLQVLLGISISATK